MENVYIYWMGNRKLPLINNSKNINLIIGPTVSEHEYLMKESSYYRQSHELRLFAFCSDVWRVWMLSKNRGLYVDGASVIGPDINVFFEKIKNYKTAVYKGTNTLIENCILWSGTSDNKIYQELFKYYCRKSTQVFTSFYGPLILTKVLTDQYNIKPGFMRTVIEKEVYIGDVREIINPKVLKKRSSGSWLDKKGTKINDQWEAWAALYDNNVKNKYLDILYERCVVDDNDIDIVALRRIYDMVEGKKYRGEIKRLYKELNYKILWDESLFWSKLYVIFVNKPKRIYRKIFKVKG